SPVPVVEDAVEVARPGGAGLAAVMAARDDYEVVLVTALADDEAGQRLAALLGQVPRLTLIRLPARGRTPVKHRIRAGTRPMVRLDSGDPTAVVERVTDTAVEALASASAILVSDYGRGVTAAPGLANALYDARGGAPVVWDPHPRGTVPVRGSRLVTPNAGEAAELARRSGLVTDP